MSIDRSFERPGIGVPDAYLSAPVAGQQLSSIGRECEGPDLLLMPGKHHRRLLGPELPELDIAGIVSGSQPASIGAEGQSLRSAPCDLVSAGQRNHAFQAPEAD